MCRIGRVQIYSLGHGRQVQVLLEKENQRLHNFFSALTHNATWLCQWHAKISSSFPSWCWSSSSLCSFPWRQLDGETNGPLSDDLCCRLTFWSEAVRESSGPVLTQQPHCDRSSSVWIRRLGFSPCDEKISIASTTFQYRAASLWIFVFRWDAIDRIANQNKEWNNSQCVRWISKMMKWKVELSTMIE